MKHFSLSVSDFALPVPRVGSIEPHSGFGRASQLGIELHQLVQAERAENHTDYQPEVSISHTFIFNKFQFTVSGKMDGLFQGEINHIEEIKSSFNIYELYQRLKMQRDDHPYCLQLKTYGYLYYLKHRQLPTLSFHLISSRNHQTIDVKIQLHIKSYEKWLHQRLLELVEEAKFSERKIKRRQLTAKNLSFPFPQRRPNQSELMEWISKRMQSNEQMLIQAPTGLGKTAGILYPMLQEGLARGQKAIYVTPKNSQQLVVEDTLKKFQSQGAKLTYLTLTAKRKICMKNEPYCDPKYCEFAEKHYTKCQEHNITDLLKKKKKFTYKTFKKIAETYQVCPFEIQFSAIKYADVIIGDYNYVFAPNASLQATNDFAESGKPNLIVDEIHNLPSRASDYYSPSLSVFLLEKMQASFDKLPQKFKQQAGILLQKSINIVNQCAPQNTSLPAKISTPIQPFMEHEAKLREFLTDYLFADIAIEPNDAVMRLCQYWSDFTTALEWAALHPDTFFTTFHQQPTCIKITCCDASKFLTETYDFYSQMVGFSATLKPFDYYRQLIGLPAENLATAEFSTPFPAERRKVLVIPQVSSKFSQRQKNYPRIAEVIQKISALKRGNYLVFFPSYRFLEETLSHFSLPPGFKISVQARMMQKKDVSTLLTTLSEPESAVIVFAVQGGVLSEGIDYPGKMAIGAFVIGPPLPTFDLEREETRKFFHQKYGRGFDFTYTFPAMAKAIQAAGRVIRRSEDKGIIVLIDDRFLQTTYANCMPSDWFQNNPHELVSRQILADIHSFWENE